MKRDPSIQQLLRGELLARSPLGYASARDAMLEALLDLLPAHTQRDPGDPGVAMLEALAATLEIFGFYHDRILTESKIGSAQLLQSVAQLGDIVGYTPRPALAAVARQFFEARAVGVVPGGSKLAARPLDGPGKLVFETLRALTLGPAFNRMPLDPIIARHVGAMRAVIRRLATTTSEPLTPLDEFPTGALAMVNGISGLELTPITGARTRAISVGRALRRSYGVLDARIHCASEYRHLRNGHPLSVGADVEGRDDIIAFEVSDRPILHIPDPTLPRRLRSTLELFIFDDRSDPRDPTTWTADQRWEEVPDFTASEAADHHYRTIVDDRLNTYVLIRRRMGYRTLLHDGELDRVYVRFTPAIGDLVPDKLVSGPPALTAHLVQLDDEYFTCPLILPRADGQAIQTLPSDWLVSERSLELAPGRQIILENADTQEKFVRTLGPRTLGQYLSWRHTPDPARRFVVVPVPPPRPLWDRVHAAIAGADDHWRTGLYLQMFGQYFPLHVPAAPVTGDVAYPVLPGRGVTHGIVDELLFVEDIPARHDPVAGWSEAGALSVSSLRSAIKAGPYHLWDHFYRQFENLDWAFRVADEENSTLEELLHDVVDGKGDPNKEAPDHDPPDWSPDLEDHELEAITIVPRGSTFLIIHDTSLIRPGDFFLLGKRDRFRFQAPAPPLVPDEDLGGGAGDGAPLALGEVLGDAIPRADLDALDDGKSAFDPRWRSAEILQAVEVHGKIVRLKWPTQNEYTLNFLTDSDGALFEPVNELIVVPQVASVFFGERFRQTLELSPNERLSQVVFGDTPPESLHLFTFDASISAFSLRQKAGWPDLDKLDDDADTVFEEKWPEVFLANFVDGVPVPVGAPAPLTLTWRLFIKLSHVGGLALAAITRIRVGIGPLLSLASLEVIELAVDAITGSNSLAYLLEVDPLDLKTAWQTLGVVAAPTQLRYWAQVAGFAWSNLEFTWNNTPSFTLPAAKFPNTADLLVPDSILKLDTRFARVVSYDEDTGALVIAMIQPGGLPPPPAEITLFAVKIDASAQNTLTQAFLVVAGAVPAPPPVFVPGSVAADPQATPDEYAAAARYPRPSLAGFSFIELLRDDADGFDDLSQIVLHLTGGAPVPEPSYQWFPNRASSLDKAKYKDLASDSLRFHNFFLVNLVDDLMVVAAPELQPGPFLLFSSAGGSHLVNGAAGTLVEQLDYAWRFMTESVIFNSGNFIPLRLGDPSFDHKTVANSLDISVRMTGQNAPIRVEYDKDLIELIDQLYSQSLDLDNLPQAYRFGFNKTPEGTFTLNFLFVGFMPPDSDSPQVLIDVHYTAEPYHGVKTEPEYTHVASHTVCEGADPVTWTEARFYQFETRPLPWNPLRQLVILNAGDLKAGDYLFIDPSGVAAELDGACQHPVAPPPAADVAGRESQRSRDHIQWTRVVEVDGRMVMVDPHVKIQPRGFHHYRVTGYRRPATAAPPDPEYYALLRSEERAQPEHDGLPRQLSFGDRLMLLPSVEDGPPADPHALVPIQRRWLLDHLVPGDRLLVWDQRWRQAWHDHRVDGSDLVPHWYDWPDHQHEVVIKRIAPRLGLVELEQRMPQRFGVAYENDAVTAGDTTFASVAAMRALPFYREPFQGPRELVAIGDGDRRVKFARLFGVVTQTLGLASLALDRPGTLASNIEVLSLDASAGEWARWTEFGRIDDAKARDRAFVLGLAPPTEDYPPECDPVIPEAPPQPGERPCCCSEASPAPGVDAPQPRLGSDLALGELGGLDLEDRPPEGSPLSVSFGDGTHGQLLPNGRANVFIRPVHVGRWCAHFPRRTRRRVLSRDRVCLPFRVEPHLAAPMNLALLVEHGAHDHWQPRGGHDEWRSSIVLEIDLADIDRGVLEAAVEQQVPSAAALLRQTEEDGVLRLRGVSDEQARDGSDGLIVRSVRPGVVELFVALRVDLVALFQALGEGANQWAARVTVFEQLRTETWRLDDVFYERVLAGDPGLHVGSDVVLLGETEGLAEGSLLGFAAGDDAREQAEVAEVEAVSHATYSATLTQGLERVYSRERSFLFGNLVEVVQGNSERQVIGSGDGATRGLRLALGNREPILHSTVNARSPGELAPGVVVLVDDVPWERVDSLEGRGMRDRVYSLELEASGKSFVRFGDGVSGAIPAAGLDNIVAVIRMGDGARGNVSVGRIDKLLDGNLAVERTRNVTAGAGGKAADDAAEARQHLMTRSFTHGRLITAGDVVLAVRALSNVVQARLDPDPGSAAIRVLVALAERQPATADTLRELERRVMSAMPIAAGVALELVDATQVGVHVVLEVSANPGFFEAELVKALEQAFAPVGDGFFALERWPIGAPLRAGDIYERAFSLPAVATARVRWLARTVEPMELPASAPDLLRLAPDELLRCDSDRIGDPYRIRGGFRVQILRGVR